MKKIFVLLAAMAVLYSCKKHDLASEFTPPLLSITDSSPVFNYFVLRTTQVSDSTDATVNTQALSVFWDEKGNKVPIQSISVNGRQLGQNFDHSLSLIYGDSANLSAEGKALAGTNAQVRVTGTSANDTSTNLVYLPKLLVEHPSAFLDSPIRSGVPLPLTWIADPNNQLGYVNVQIIYDGASSQAYNPIFPASQDPITYKVPDNGSFTIPDTGLSLFPVGSFLIIRIARVSEIKSTLPASGKKVYYWGISEILTPSLQLMSPVQ